MVITLLDGLADIDLLRTNSLGSGYKIGKSTVKDRADFITTVEVFQVPDFGEIGNERISTYHFDGLEILKTLNPIMIELKALVVGNCPGRSGAIDLVNVQKTTAL